MSKRRKNIVISEGFLDNLIDSIYSKIAAKDPKAKRLKARLSDMEKELEDLVDKEYDGKEPSWLKIARRK